MPSFSNGNGNYHFYLNLPKHHQTSLTKCRILYLFVKYMVISIVCGLLMHSWHYIWDYFDANDYDSFMGQHWYFEFDIMLVLWQCVLVVTWCLVLASTLYPYSLLYKMAIAPSKYKREFLHFFSLILIATFICLVPIAWLTFGDEDSGKQPVFNHDGWMCSWLLCKFIYVRFMLIYCLYPGVLPVVLWCIWYVYYLCYLKPFMEKEEVDNVTDDPYDSSIPHKSMDSGISEINTKLLDPSNPNVNVEDAENHMISALDRQTSHNWSMKKIVLEYQHHHQRPEKDRSFQMRYPFTLLLLWCCSFILSFLFGYIHGRPIEKHFEAIYFTFSLYTAVFKFFMKKLARRCDYYRAQISPSNYVFSIEYFMEFYWSLTYWMIYRFYTVFHAPSTGQFVVTLCVHLFWEMCAVMLRYHDFYFRKSNQIIMKNYALLHHFHDGHDCTVKLWRDRLSMDLVVKLWCCVFSGCFFAIDYKLCFNMYSEQLEDHAPSDLVIKYLATATIAEFLFYVLTIEIGRFALSYDIMFPFVYYCKRLTPSHAILLLFLYGCVVIPVY